MERDEADRLEAVKKMLLSETEKLKSSTIEKDNELEQLKRQTAS
jgi:hypothetical protein